MVLATQLACISYSFHMIIFQVCAELLHTICVAHTTGSDLFFVFSNQLLATFVEFWGYKILLVHSSRLIGWSGQQFYILLMCQFQTLVYFKCSFIIVKALL